MLNATGRSVMNALMSKIRMAPEEAYSPIRGQYFTMVLLQKLELLKSSDKEKVLALVDEDDPGEVVEMLLEQQKLISE